MLVAYAAQRGLFTPAMRIGSAGLLGLIAMGVGEALRRGVGAKGTPNLLVSALITAAGAAMLYAAIWAAYLLYHFIPAGAAGTLLAVVSLALLGLALLHGEALGLLAIAAAYAVPVVSGGGGWGGDVLDGFILLILATGMAASGLRHWGKVGAFALAGAGLWAVARGWSSDPAAMTLIAAMAPLLALAATAFARRKTTDQVAPAGDLFAALPTAAVIGASLFAVLAWGQGASEGPRDAMLLTVAIILAVPIGLRVGGLSAALLWAPAGVCVLAAILLSSKSPQPSPVLWLAPALAVLAAAGFDGACRSDRRRSVAVAGAAGAAFSLTLAAPALARALPGLDWTVAAAFAVLFAAFAVIVARRSDDPATDWTPAAFIAAAAETAGLALHAAVDGRLAPTAYGLLAVCLAALATRIKWRGFAESAAVAALASLAGLLARPVAGDALSGVVGWAPIAAATGAATLAQLAAWRTLKTRADVAASAEAVSTVALVSGLLGAFLVLQTWGATGHGAGRIDDFTQASLRTLLMLAAGLMLALRGSATRFGRARAVVLLIVGAAHGLILQGWILHPWWGLSSVLDVARPVVGPPLADGLLLGLLAPALLLAEAARRGRSTAPKFVASALATALAFLILWLFSELRRLFHGPSLGVGPFGYAETAAYAAATLGLALALEAGRARFAATASASGGFASVINAVAWTSLGLALWLLGFLASPWWGPIGGDLRAPVLLAALYLAGCGFSAGLALLARRSGRKPLAQAALIAAGAQVFVLLTLVVRYAFHGAAMRAPLREASLETWTFSAVWALYGLTALAAGASRRDMPLRGLGLVVLLATTVKVFLFDMAKLEGVVRAASFLALGAVLLIGALAARRFASQNEHKSEPSENA